MISQVKRTIVSAFIWFFGLVIAVPILLFITIVAIIFPHRWYNPLGQLLLRFIMRVFGARVTAEGLEHIDPRATYLFMVNHVSLFDVPVLGGYIPNFTRGIQAVEQMKRPVIGWFLKAIGMIPIQRSSAHASWSVLERAVEELRTGKSILIMPESTRTRTGKMQDFKKLPFRLAQMAEVDLVPIGLSGLYRFKSRVSWHLRPGPIKIKFGAPISNDQVKKMSLEELQALVRQRIESLVEEP
ncbi:1-acyl-sn-glycerol-3-phosphate acyltransferase [candidate division KSB1 bacterium]|nr:1-acyl-sn-glycerol-3-phosphate acyltransferase [candidate division KSB1 bacterium]